MSHIATISELLQKSDSQYRIFDISRRIEKLSKDQFEKIELNQLPYPTPSQGHAFIAIAFWQKKSIEPYLWVVKFPLDERGLLNQGARNHFVAIIVEALGSDLTADPTKKQEELLKNNPYIFTPAQYKLAALNSKIKVELKQEASEFLSPFETYLTGELGWDNWQVVGVQGITDFAARLQENDKQELLAKAIAHLPEQVLLPLCGALENELLPLEIIEQILKRLSESLKKSKALYSPSNKSENAIELDEQAIILQQHLLRSLGANTEHPHVKAFIQGLLQQEHLATDLLITLSGRCWLALQQDEQLMQFFEHLVKSDDASLFNHIFKDLVAIPTIRPIVFQCMRSPQRSSALAQAIGQLFNKMS